MQIDKRKKIEKKESNGFMSFVKNTFNIDFDFSSSKDEKKDEQVESQNDLWTDAQKEQELLKQRNL